MSMAYGLISDTKAPVRQGTVIKLTEANLKADPKDSAATAVKAMYESRRDAPKYESHQVGPIRDVKHQIQMMSLFPNVANSGKSYKKGETGTFRSGMPGF
jgi:predicted metalloendopeptidase